RGWRNAVASQDVTDSLVGNTMAEVGESANDAVVSPARVLAGHPDDEGFDLRRDRGTPWAGRTFGSVEFLGNQPAVPSHDGIREGDGGNLLKVLAAEPLADLRESRALRIGKAQTRSQMRAEDAILGDEVFILEQQALVHQACYVRQQPRPLVVAHGERT